MSSRTEEKPSGGQGLSVTTLVIASLSSIAAALFIHKFWTGGAILGAGITPVIVALVSESLKKPTRVITERRQSRPPGPSAMRGAPDMMPVEPTRAQTRDDRFGIWEDQHDEGPRFHKVRGRSLKLAIATGVVAFVVGAFLLTGTQLVFGGGGDGADRLTIVPGTQKKTDDPQHTQTTTAPVEEIEPVPPEQVTPTTTTPAVPTVPPTTPVPPPVQSTPPAETAPAPVTPAPPATQPAPAG